MEGITQQTIFSDLIKVLEKWTWKISYFYALVLGLSPAPYNFKTHRFQYSLTYLWYSALIQVTCLMMYPLSTPLFASEASRQDYYMHSNAILVWTYYVGKATRILANLVLSLEIWLNRKQILDLYQNYWTFSKKYEEFCQRYNMHDDMKSELNSIRCCTIYKFCSSHANSITISCLYLQMLQQASVKHYLIELTNFIQSFYLLEFGMELFVIMSQMHLHFVYINKSLQMMDLESFSNSSMFLRCQILWGMHLDCYTLTRRMLKICRKIGFVVLIKIFTTNINMLYHAVQFANGGIITDEISTIVGLLSIVSFYWDTILTVIGIDNLLTSCNRTAKTLALNAGVLMEWHAEDCFCKMISHFHDYLACHQLTINICGLIPLNKSSCLKYFLSVLVHLTVLVQFDMKSKPAEISN
uniref:Gustatory receptor n=1 Tax=Stomoxys calcitrans TaxID=35570 RepID=A0A1I8PEY2_STOCA